MCRCSQVVRFRDGKCSSIISLTHRPVWPMQTRLQAKRVSEMFVRTDLHGQKGRCVDLRMRDHNLSLRSATGGLLHGHCRDCLSYYKFYIKCIIGRGRYGFAGGLLESCAIEKECTGNCVKHRSLRLCALFTLSRNEPTHLHRHLVQLRGS